MYMKRLTFLVLFIGGLLLELAAQQVYISKFASGDYLYSEQHRVELFNESPRSVDLSDYLLVTRQYVARLPRGTRIAPWGTLKLGKTARNGQVDVAYSDLQEFSLRIPTPRKDSKREHGDFAVLIDERIQIVDAFYFSDQARVDFLPTRENFMTQAHDIIRISVPDERSAIWSSILMPPDPTMVFVRINDQWEVNARDGNLIDATEYARLKAAYEAGVITLTWSTLFEKDCYYHVVERRSGPDSFRMLSRKPAVGNSELPQEYTFYDNKIQENKSYEYRLRHTDKFGNSVYSQEVSVDAGDDLGGVSMDHFREGTVQNIRFSSSKNQQIRIQLLDEEFRQIALLFSDQVEADKQMLLQYKPPLPVGKYYLVAESPQKRIYKDFIVDN